MSTTEQFRVLLIGPIDCLIELLALFGRSGLVPTSPGTVREDAATMPSAADVPQSLSVPLSYEI